MTTALSYPLQSRAADGEYAKFSVCRNGRRLLAHTRRKFHDMHVRRCPPDRELPETSRQTICH